VSSTEEGVLVEALGTGRQSMLVFVCILEGKISLSTSVSPYSLLSRTTTEISKRGQYNLLPFRCRGR